MSTNFTDTEGRQWSFHIDYDVLDRVKRETDVMLTDVLDPQSESARALSEDPLRLLHCIVATLAEQIDAKNLSPAQFRKGINGEVMEKAYVAFEEAIIDFFPPRKAERLRKLRDKVTEAQARQELVALTKLDRLTTTTDFDDLFATSTPGNSDSSSPENAASNPGDSASGS